MVFSGAVPIGYDRAIYAPFARLSFVASTAKILRSLLKHWWSGRATVFQPPKYIGAPSHIGPFPELGG